MYNNDTALNLIKILSKRQEKYLQNILQLDQIDRDLVLDKNSYFLITVNNYDNFINIEQFCYNCHGKSYSIFFKDKTAKSLCWTIFEVNQLNIIISAEHAAYLGRELIKSELAILLNQKYIQD